MKLPSMETLATGFKKVLSRFPFEILSATVGTITAIYLVDLDEYKDPSFAVFLRLLLTSNISLLLFLSGTFICETGGINKWIIRAVALFLSVLCFLYIHPEIWPIHFLLFSLLAAALHLLVSFAPYIKKGTTHAFWQFNKNLFLRFLTSALYSGVIYLGLVLALMAIHELFEVQIDGIFYFRLWIIIAGLFNTLFFLAGIPENLDALEQDQSYPKGLKIFTQYVLLPLVTIYLVILLLYEFKIIFLWNLPKGWVSNLIIAYGIFGTLSILLVYPVRNDEQNKWISVFSKSFYYLLLPLVVLMYVAILKRISEYGFTESRYLVLVVGIWLTFIALYFILSGKQNIKIIPVTLFIVTLLSAIGPQSAFNVSQHSQRSVIKDVFEKNNRLHNGKIEPLSDKDTVANQDAKKVDNAIEYLVKNHGINSLRPLFNSDFDTLIVACEKDFTDTASLNNRWESHWKITKRVMAYMNLKYTSDIEQSNNVYLNNGDEIFDTKDYDLVCSGDFYLETASFYSGADTIDIEKTITKDSLMVTVNGDQIPLDLKPVLHNLYDYAQTNGEDDSASGKMMQVVADGKKYQVKIIFKNLSFHESEKEGYKLESFNFLMLVKKL